MTCQLRHDLRGRVGERHDERLVGHLGQELRLQDAGGGEAEEHVGTFDAFVKTTLIALLAIDRLPLVHQRLAAEIDEAFDVVDPDVFLAGAERDEQVEAGEGGRAGTGGDDLHLGDVLAGKFQAVQDGRGDDDRRAMLVIVEDRDVHLLAKLAFDLETLRRLDVLEVDAAEGRLERRDGRDHAVDLVGIDLDVEDVDAGELLEEDGLALHHRLGRQWADIAEAENRRSVRDDGDEVGSGRIVGCGVRVVTDGKAGGGDAGRIGERQVALVAERLGRLDLKFARARVTVEEEGLLVEVA